MRGTQPEGSGIHGGDSIRVASFRKTLGGRGVPGVRGWSGVPCIDGRKISIVSSLPPARP
jgi:hypothetical protein